MKFLVIFFAVFFQMTMSNSVLANELTPGETFEFTTQANGDFTLEMDAVLSPSVSLSAAHDGLLNPKILSGVSKIITSASVEANGPNHYTLITAWGRFGINKQLISDCTEIMNPSGFEETCKLRVTKNLADANDKGQTASLFVDGGTNTVCTQMQIGGSVTCSIKVFGQAKSFRVLMVSKAGSDMALNGAGFSLHDTSLVFEMLSENKSAAQVTASYAGSNLEALVLALYNQLNPVASSIPAGHTLFGQGDTRTGLSSFKMGLR
jgi:hypothetical protein